MEALKCLVNFIANVKKIHNVLMSGTLLDKVVEIFSTISPSDMKLIPYTRIVLQFVIDHESVVNYLIKKNFVASVTKVSLFSHAYSLAPCTTIPKLLPCVNYPSQDHISPASICRIPRMPKPTRSQRIPDRRNHKIITYL